MEDSKASGAHCEGHPLHAPGLKWRPRINGDIPMWIPPAKDIKSGYFPKSLMLDRHASPLELAETCRRQWKDLEDWRENKPKAVRLTIGWLIDRYLSDTLSPFQKLDRETQKSYGWECKRIKETVGDRLLTPKKVNGLLVPRILGHDLSKWHYHWGHPTREEILSDGSIKMVELRPTPSRARHCIAMLRTLFSYNITLGTIGAVELRAILKAMRFEGSNARSIAPTYEQVDAVVSKAQEMGYRSIAITTLAQFELIERRTHIIGKWRDNAWGYGWAWDDHMQIAGRTEWVGVTPDWRIRYYQTKKGANLREFDLKVVQRLLGLMQLTPKDQRHGPIIICEDTGLPWIKRRYQEKFREIARAAGVPDEVYSMDMRAGGTTEADGIEEVQQAPRLLDHAGGWRDPNMKERYSRGKQRAAQKVVELRQAARNKP